MTDADLRAAATRRFVDQGQLSTRRGSFNDQLPTRSEIPQDVVSGKRICPPGDWQLSPQDRALLNLIMSVPDMRAEYDKKTPAYATLIPRFATVTGPQLDSNGLLELDADGSVIIVAREEPPERIVATVTDWLRKDDIDMVKVIGITVQNLNESQGTSLKIDEAISLIARSYVEELHCLGRTVQDDVPTTDSTDQVDGPGTDDQAKTLVLECDDTALDDLQRKQAGAFLNRILTVGLEGHIANIEDRVGREFVPTIDEDMNRVGEWVDVEVQLGEAASEAADSLAQDQNFLATLSEEESDFWNPIDIAERLCLVAKHVVEDFVRAPDESAK